MGVPPGNLRSVAHNYPKYEVDFRWSYRPTNLMGHNSRKSNLSISEIIVQREDSCQVAHPTPQTRIGCNDNMKGRYMYGY